MNKQKGKSPKFVLNFKRNGLVAAAKSAGLSTNFRWRATTVSAQYVMRLEN